MDVETSGLSTRRNRILQIGVVTVEPTARSSNRGRRSCGCAGRGAGSVRARSTASPAARCVAPRSRTPCSTSCASAWPGRCSPPTTPSSTPPSSSGPPLAITCRWRSADGCARCSCSRRLDPDRQLTHGLADLCARYDVALERHHDALADATATAAILPHLLAAHGVVRRVRPRRPLLAAAGVGVALEHPPRHLGAEALPGGRSPHLSARARAARAAAPATGRWPPGTWRRPRHRGAP